MIKISFSTGQFLIGKSLEILHIFWVDIPSGFINFSGFQPILSWAAFINFAQTGNAALEPDWLTPKLTFGSSTPNQTPAAIFGENPTNHASVQFWVVPVLPPAGWVNLYFHLALPPVPLSTTDCNKSVTK